MSLSPLRTRLYGMACLSAVASASLAGCANEGAPASAPGSAPVSAAKTAAAPLYDMAPPAPSARAPMGGSLSPQFAGAVPPPVAPPSAETYAHLVENPVKSAKADPLSTFSVDVDTASYSNVRRFLTNNTLPPKDAVRIEELINYFPYEYPKADKAAPFAVNVEVAACPWADGKLLAKIGIKAREIDNAKRPPANLVFLLDVSGSMSSEDKLPLVKKALRLLVENLGENDRVAVVVYAGASGLVLPSTTCDRKAQILASLEQLQAGGSTNGASGIQLAYDTAVGGFIKGGTNRVILCTDGDFNVGITSRDDLTRLIEAKAKSGVFLSVLGFGMGNLKDNTIERLADRGNGNAAYIDSIQEAKKVLVEQMGGTLVTVAKDVKIQVEFNPKHVESYRLIGYENRIMKAQDFHDDKKDAGEIGAGHTVTALYELVPKDFAVKTPGVDALKYQQKSETSVDKEADLFLVKLRYKAPDAQESKLIEFSVERGDVDPTPSDDLRFAAAVASFGMLLRDSAHKGDATWDDVVKEAEASLGSDPNGYRHEFVDLVRKAKTLQGH